MVSRSRFPFWRFLWVYLSLNFLYKLKFWLQNIPIDSRKADYVRVFFNLHALFQIWAFSSIISSGVYNRRSFCHRSWLALFTSQQSSPWTFRFGAGCASLYKRSHCTFASQLNICRLEFICADCTESVRLSQTISQVSHKCLKVLETKRNCYLHWTWTQTYGYLHWTIPVKDRHLWQFLENKGCLIPFKGSFLEYNAHDVLFKCVLFADFETSCGQLLFYCCILIVQQ